MLILIIVFPMIYLNFLSDSIKHPGLKLREEWRDTTFNTWFENPVHSIDLKKDWSISWVHGQTENSAGFKAANDTLMIYATFSGYNETYVNGASGIMIQKNMFGFNTSLSPFIVIAYSAYLVEPALALSLGVVTTNGTSYYAPSFSINSGSSYLSYNLNDLYSGEIQFLTLRFTNDNDPHFSDGTYSINLDFITFFEKPQTWSYVASNSVKGNIIGVDGVLNVSMVDQHPEGIIVTAQRTHNLPAYLASNNFAKIVVRTSSINIATRVVLWINPYSPREILLKTYNDTNWHTEIVSLPFLGISGDVHKIELGMVRLYSSNSTESVSYKEISFANLEL